MKDYNKKKKKRKFEVIINNKSKGIYSNYSPIKTAKKVINNLIGNRKYIIFYLKEKLKNEKNKKKIGPYIGYIKDGKAFAKIYKIKGGSNDFDWDSAILKNLFLNSCQYIPANSKKISSIYVQYKELKIKKIVLPLFIFGNKPIKIAGREILQYFYYLQNDELKFKRSELGEDNNIKITDISFDDLSNIKITNSTKSKKETSITSLLIKQLEILKNSSISNSEKKLIDKFIEKYNKKNSI